MVVATALLLGVLLDALLLEPRRYHPLVGFGLLARACEQRFNHYSGRVGIIVGCCALLLLLLPALFIGVVLWYWLLSQHPGWAVIVGAAGLYWALGGRSLHEHVVAVEEALLAGDIAAARINVGLIVSRDCTVMTTLQIRRAALESLLENTSDAIIAPLFWFALAGLPGVIIYRLSNTLDAMWGYKTAHFISFGKAAARWDDMLNILPARLTALAFATLGDGVKALHAWRYSAHHWASPNAGPVIAAGAGALNISLGGGAFYGGQWQEKPLTELGESPQAGDCWRAQQLVKRTTYGCCLLLVTLVLLWGGL